MRQVLRAVVAIVAVGVAGGALLAVAPSASAQACDPVYGCATTTTSTTAPDAGTTIELDVDTGEEGTVVQARACGYLPGSQVSLTFGGQAIEAGTAGADGCVLIRFVVPPLPVGVYPVCATSPGRPAACADFTLTGVLGTGGGQPGTGAGGSGGSGGGDDGSRVGAGALARTGAAIGLLALLGALLVLGGRAVRRAGSDRGRREMAR